MSVKRRTEPEELVVSEERPAASSDGAVSSEPTRINGELDQRVAQRTAELDAAYRALKAEMRQQHRAREASRHLSAIVESSEDAIIGKTLDGTILSWNRAAERIFGYSAKEAIGQSIFITVPADLVAPMQAIHERVARGERLEHGETRRMRKDGRVIDISLSHSPIQDDSGRVVGISAIARDITQRKDLEKQVLELVAEEQRRIGQDLHDSTGQELTGVILVAESLHEVLTEHNSPEVGYAAKIVAGLKRALKQVRELSRGLVPVQVDAEGLMAALKELADRINEIHAGTCSFECTTPVAIKNNSTATHLYRIAQEAVSNALKHGQARDIQITLGLDEQRVVLRIEDDGIGIDRRDEAGRGMGLQIMRYRAGLIKARFSIVPRKQGGTRVTCNLPKEDPDAAS
ncbi:MAG: PAS domain S-box protein [Gemmataceae bacterium]|nr:PAS domain S-box protein [Gemmataceae bacterium]